MARFFKKREAILGKRPGEMIYVGKHSAIATKVDETIYSAKSIKKIPLQKIQNLNLPVSSENLWVNIVGISDVSAMEAIKSKYGIDYLIIADIMNTAIRPKFQNTDFGLFLSLKMLSYDGNSKKIISEQLSFLLDKNLLISFQEAEGDVFNSVRDRLTDDNATIRKTRIDYLLFSLLDSVVDNYILILQEIAELIEDLEEDLLDKPDEETLRNIIFHKKELLFLSKSIKPFKDVVKQLVLDTPQCISGLEDYYTDLLSNLTQIVETIDIYKEILNQQQNTYDTYTNNKLNDIMKFLTIFSVIFLPLTLITGIYGTNFDFIPELHFKYGYLFLWGLLCLFAFIMILVFKKKRWF